MNKKSKKVTCVVCGTVFLTEGNRTLRCYDCGTQRNRERALARYHRVVSRNAILKPVECELCGVAYIREHSRSRYCLACKEVKANTPRKPSEVKLQQQERFKEYRKKFAGFLGPVKKKECQHC